MKKRRISATIVLTVVFTALFILGLTQFLNPNMENSITGFAIAPTMQLAIPTENEIAIPNQTTIILPQENITQPPATINQTPPQDIPLPITLNPSTQPSISNQTTQLPSPIGIQAGCSAWPCTCGASVTASITMTSNLGGCNGHGLEVGASDITINCNGYNISSGGAASNGYSGIASESRNNIVIKNCNFNGYGRGITLTGTTFANITNNNATNVSYGIALQNSNSNRIINNRLFATNGYTTYGINMLLSGVFTSNGSLSNYNTIANNTIQHSNHGIYLKDYSRYNNITNNSLFNISNSAINAQNAWGNNISLNIINRTQDGLLFANGYAALYPISYIHQNTIDNASQYAIQLSNDGYYTFYNNTIRNSRYGFYDYFGAGFCNGCGAHHNLSYNNFTDNTYALYFSKNIEWPANFNNNITETNTINGKPIFYRYQINNSIINQTVDPATIYLIDSHFTQIANISLGQSTYYATYLYFSNNTNITNVTINTSYTGMLLEASGNTTLRNVTLTLNTQEGLHLLNATGTKTNNVTITSNNITGLYVESSPKNNLSTITISNHTYNFRISSSSSTDYYNLYNQTIENTTVNSRYLTYFFQRANEVINQTNNTGNVYITYSSNINISNINASAGNYYGVFFYNSNTSSLKYSSTADNYIGVQIENSHNLTINQNSYNNTQYIYLNKGIYATGSPNLNISQNTLKNATNGVYITGSPQNLIDSNNIFSMSSTGVSVLSSSDYTNITNNSIENQSLNLIYIEGSTFSRAISNRVRSGQYGLQLGWGATESFIQYNNASNSSSMGFYISTNNNILLNNLGTNNGYAVYISTQNNTLANNTLHNNTNGLGISSSGNSILNNSIKGSIDIGVYFSGASQNSFNNNFYQNNSKVYFFSGTSGYNNFSQETITNNTAGVTNYINTLGMMFLTMNQPNLGNTWYNSNFSRNTYDLNLTGSLKGDTYYFANSSYNKTESRSGTMTKSFLQWYIDVNITNRSNGAPIIGANVSAYLFNGSLDYSNLTGTDGTARLLLSEQYKESNINYILTTHTIRAFKGGFTKNSTTANLRNVTSNLGFINITLGQVSCGDTITSDFIMGENLYCENNGLHLNASDLTIDGNNFSIYGKQNGVGLDIQNRSGLNINLLHIRNFTTGIHIFNANYSNISNATYTNNTYAIVFNNSKQNTVKSPHFANNSWSTLAISTQETNNTLLNATITQNNVSISGLANVFRSWISTVHVLISGTTIPLQGATINGTFNLTSTFDSQATTGSNGIAYIQLKEAKWNSTGFMNLTPHTITGFISAGSNNPINNTYTNLTSANNTEPYLYLALDCIIPSTGMQISSSTTLCPGSYNTENMQFTASSINLTCLSTNFVAPSSTSELIVSSGQKTNIGIIGCGISGYARALYGYVSDGIMLQNNTFSNCGYSLWGTYDYKRCIEISLSNNAYIQNNSFSASTLYFYISHDAFIHNNRFEDNSGNYALELDHSDRMNITNSTFDDNTAGIRFASGWEQIRSNETIIYNNTFSDSSTYHISYYGGPNDPGSQADYIRNITNSFNLTQNWSVNITTRGNAYDDYCNKGKDNNGDGYADTNLSGTDYPMNSTVSTKIAGFAQDFGPKIQTCVTEVQVGAPSSSTTSGGGSSSSSAAAIAAPAETPAVAPAAPQTENKNHQTSENTKETTQEIYTASDTNKFLKREISSARLDTKSLEVQIQFENTGTKEMRLLPELFQDIDDPYYIVTKKTLATKGSLSEKISKISYSNDPIAGRLLKATVVNPEQIILQPGEKINKKIEIKEGLGSPKQIKIQFTTLGENVFEEDLTEKAQKKSFTGTAIDLDTDKNVIDIYALFVPADLTEKLEEYYAKESNKITGGAVTDIKTPDQFFFELQINPVIQTDIQNKNPASMPGLFSISKTFTKNQPETKTAFSDLYGPYDLKEKQSFIFAQQLSYQESQYHGPHKVIARIYKGDIMLVENSFDVDFE